MALACRSEPSAACSPVLLAAMSCWFVVAETRHKPRLSGFLLSRDVFGSASMLSNAGNSMPCCCSDCIERALCP